MLKFFVGPLVISLVAACAASPSIQAVASSRSAFEGAVYSGETSTEDVATTGSTEYRVFNHASSGFVSIVSVRIDAKQRATEFCQRKSRSMRTLRETVAKPPYILGNFPRIEIIFECSVPATRTNAQATDESIYKKLADLKKLLDDGTLTQAEFDAQKAKILHAQ